MALPVGKINETLLAWLTQVQTFVCDAKKQGADITLEQDISIKADLIAPDGENSLFRISIVESGQQQTTVASPARTERTETDQAVSTSVASASESISTATRIEPVQTVTRTAKPRSSTSQKSGTASVAETTESQSSEQTTARINSGGNTITRSTDYQSI